MTAERIDLASLRVGDKVTITFEVRNTTPPGGAYLRHGTDEFYVGNAHTYHGTVERAPRPLEVGETVWWHGAQVEIRAIDGDAALVRRRYGGAPSSALISDLTREACHD